MTTLDYAVPFAAVLAAHALGAQLPPSPLRPADEAAVGALRQVTRPLTRSRLDHLADSVAKRAIDRADQGQTNEILILERAGQRPEPRRLTAGVPFDGAVDRLIQIHKGAPNSILVVRAQALRSMNEVVGFDRARLYLRSVATSADPTADVAMAVLTDDAAPDYHGTLDARDRTQTLAMLRSLWARVDEHVPMLAGPAGVVGKEAVPEYQAWEVLHQFARRQGWAK